MVTYSRPCLSHGLSLFVALGSLTDTSQRPPVIACDGYRSSSIFAPYLDNQDKQPFPCRTEKHPMSPRPALIYLFGGHCSPHYGRALPYIKGQAFDGRLFPHSPRPWAPASRLLIPHQGKPSRTMSYSEFFTSGFLFSCAATTMSLHRVPHTTSHIFNFTRRSQSVSLPTTPSTTPSKRKKSSQRFSFLSFSSWFFHSRTESDTRSSSPSPSTDDKQALSLDVDIANVLTSPYLVPSSSQRLVPFLINIILVLISTPSHLLDPFAASPKSSSFFSDPPSPSPPYQSSRSTSLDMYEVFPDPPLFHHPAGRAVRDRPTSVQSVPLPSRSQRDFHSPRWSSRRTQPEPFTGPLLDHLTENDRPTMPEPFDEDTHGWSDPAHHVDWRQFHNELLGD